MKNIIIKAMLLPVVLVFLTGCSITRKVAPQAPVSVQVQLTMEDVEYVGIAEGTSVQKYVLGLPIGGRARTFGAAPMITGFTSVGIPGTRGMNNAMFDALSTVPDADFILPISTTSTRDVDFLGSTVTLSVRAKAFKIKEK